MANTSRQPQKKPRQKSGRPDAPAKQSRSRAKKPPASMLDPSLDPRQQPYDNLLKRLVAHQYEDMIRLLLRDQTITQIEPINVELLPPIQRGDLIFRILYQDEWHILHFEFETSPDGHMDRRLHHYSGFLWYEYGLPVLSFLFYPFQDSRVKPPMIHRSKQKIIDTFDYTLLRTWDLDAREWINDPQAVPFYGMLPTMENLTKELLLEGIDRIIEHYQDDQKLLREELLCFKVMLQRAERLAEADMEIVLRRIEMYDPLLEEDPWIKELQKKSLAKGRTKGRTEGELKQARATVVRFIQRRFPMHSDLAQAKMLRAKDIEDINALMEQLWVADDEYAVRALLDHFGAKP
jgi:predicted transposase YdaD